MSLPYRPSFMLTSETKLTVFAGMAEQTPEEWRALLEWCRFHDMDPHAMPASQIIIRNVEACRVEYDRYVLTDSGHVQRDPESSNPDALWVFRAHSQGEAPPLPFPGVILRDLDKETA